MTQTSGLFITVEGPEGSGKSTILAMVADQLRQQGTKVILTREPGGSVIAEQIRKVILYPDQGNMDKRTEALLYAAARRQHLVETVIPALSEGKVVLCDRFVHSSLAYQGCARGIGMEEIMDINRFAIEEYMPDLTIYFDIDPQIGLDRIRQNNLREVNRFDQERIEFHQKVREAYLSLEEMFPSMVKINAENGLTQVLQDVMKLVKAEIDGHQPVTKK